MFSKEGSAVGKKKGSAAVDVAVRKSDRRKVRDVARKSLLALDDDDDSMLDNIFLQGSLTVRKLQHDQLGRKIQLYFRSSSDELLLSLSSSSWPYYNSSSSSTQHEECVWMSVDGGGPNKAPIECPSIAFLSVLPKSLPTVVVPTQVSKYLCRGANLMRAGIISLPVVNAVDQKNNNNIVAVRIHGNDQPFAVGYLTPDTNTDTIGQDAQGVGVEIWMCYGDSLWRSTTLDGAVSSSSPLENEGHRVPTVGNNNPIGGAPYNNGHYGNVGFLNGEIVRPIVRVGCAEEGNDESGATGTDSSSKEQSAAAAAAAAVTDSEAPNKEDEEEEDPTMVHNDLLHQSFCKALVNIKDKELPIAANALLSQHVLPHRPEGTSIEIKKTSFKKFGTYLLYQQREGLITVAQDTRDKNPAGFLKSINRKHEDLRGLKKGNKKPKDDGKTRLAIATLYAIPHHFVSRMRLDPDDAKAANAKSEDRRGTGLLTGPEIKGILDKYLEREELVSSCGTEATLDGPLTDALYKKSKEAAPMTLSRKDLSEKWTAKMDPGYALVQMPGSKILTLKRGSPSKVTMEVSMRQGKKFITRLRGIEEYGLNGEDFCRDVSKRFACSGGVETDEPTMGNLKKGHVELVFQGHLAEELRALLIGDERLTSHGGAKDSPYSLPKQCVEVKLKKGVPARKRK